ncbi:hypothetical protein LWI29_017102 [Acer saccharum]|uniref:Uncharacterized protein n=1 Tax=Acer saccharum TaxID=4024 RepID=A0AA39SDX8_ACESA|nr:hypothetical protein LWI29_017102 [Acer saccharum]
MGCGISKIDPEEVGNVADTRFLPKHAAAPTQLEDAESLDYDHSFDRKSVSSAMGGNIGKVACGGGDGGDEDTIDNQGGINVRENKGGNGHDDYVKVRSDGDCGDNRGSILAGREDSIVVCPGSPSFREYCVSTNVSKNGRNSINNHEGRSGANVGNKSQGEESLHKQTTQPSSPVVEDDGDGHVKRRHGDGDAGRAATTATRMGASRSRSRRRCTSGVAVAVAAAHPSPSSLHIHRRRRFTSIAVVASRCRRSWISPSSSAAGLLGWVVC